MRQDEVIRTLEIFSNGLTRFTLSTGAEDSWIDSWAVDEVMRSLQSLRDLDFPRQLSSSDRDSDYFRLEVTFRDAETGEETRRELETSSGDLSQELHAIHRWVWTRLKTAANQPVWVSGPMYPTICQPENRREKGLAVEDPFWCEGRVGGPTFGEGITREQIRQQLRERLRKLPRGLQDARETTEN